MHRRHPFALSMRPCKQEVRAGDGGIALLVRDCDRPCDRPDCRGKAPSGQAIHQRGPAPRRRASAGRRPSAPGRRWPRRRSGGPRRRPRGRGSRRGKRPRRSAAPARRRRRHRGGRRQGACPQATPAARAPAPRPACSARRNPGSMLGRGSTHGAPMGCLIQPLPHAPDRREQAVRRPVEPGCRRGLPAHRRDPRQALEALGDAGRIPKVPAQRQARPVQPRGPRIVAQAARRWRGWRAGGPGYTCPRAPRRWPGSPRRAPPPRYSRPACACGCPGYTVPSRCLARRPIPGAPGRRFKRRGGLPQVASKQHPEQQRRGHTAEGQGGRGRTGGHRGADGAALREYRPGTRRVALLQEEYVQPVERVYAERRRQPSVGLEQALQPAAPFAQTPRHDPEAPERGSQAHPPLPAFRCRPAPGEGDPVSRKRWRTRFTLAYVPAYGVAPSRKRVVQHPTLLVRDQAVGSGLRAGSGASLGMAWARKPTTAWSPGARSARACAGASRPPTRWPPCAPSC